MTPIRWPINRVAIDKGKMLGDFSDDLSIKHHGELTIQKYPKMGINREIVHGLFQWIWVIWDALSWPSRLGWPVCMVHGSKRGIKGWENPRSISIWDTIGCHIFWMFRFTTCFFKVDGQRLATIYGIRVTRDLEWWNMQRRDPYGFPYVSMNSIDDN